MHKYDPNDEYICNSDVNTITPAPVQDKTTEMEAKYSKMWLSYNDFKEIADNMYKAMERNRKFGVLMCDQMLRNLDFLNNVEKMDSIGTDFATIEQQFLKRVEEHKVMFTSRSTKDLMFESPQLMTPTGIFNNHYATKKRIMSYREKNLNKQKRAKHETSNVTPLITFT